jgi:hypothetical protein
VIDYEIVKETGGGARFDRLTALLIGLIAVMAAMLVVVQTTQSLAEARANAEARRLASELTTRIIVAGNLASHQGVNGQRALLLGMAGNNRQIVSLGTGDAADGLIGQAQVAAGERLLGVAARMGATPGADTPLDPYAADVLGDGMAGLQPVLAEQNRQADLAGVASTRSTLSVMGLSVVALAGVLVGLAAVVGAGRAGRALLIIAWLAGAGAAVLLVLASGVLPDGVLPLGLLRR